MFYKLFTIFGVAGLESNKFTRGSIEFNGQAIACKYQVKTKSTYLRNVIMTLVKSI